MALFQHYADILVLCGCEHEDSLDMSRDYHTESGHCSHLHSGRLADDFIQSDLQQVYFLGERETTTYRCRYSKDVYRTKCQAPIITRVNPFPVYNEDSQEKY
jgi:hypothetical protein